MHKIIILLVVLYGCEILSPILREGQRLRATPEQGAQENVWI
jgi:hypothetical protein